MFLAIDKDSVRHAQGKKTNIGKLQVKSTIVLIYIAKRNGHCEIAIY